MGERLELRGYLVIYVDGFKMRRNNMLHLIAMPEGGSVAIPDPLVPAPLYDVGSREWWDEAWAVGDNSREKLCKVSGPKDLRQFHDYDEAVAFMMARQRRHKAHRHHLVYVTRDSKNLERRDRVSSWDDIKAVHAAQDRAASELKAQKADEQRRFDANFPHLKELEVHFKRSKALTLAGVLREISDKGMETAKSSMPRTTWYRVLKDLKQAGLAPES